MHSPVFLKVKIKGLAAEAKFMRKEENKVKRSFRWLKANQGYNEEYSTQNELYNHLHWQRTVPLAQEARATLIAYGFLRGHKYEKIEKPRQPFRKNKVETFMGEVYTEFVLDRAYELINTFLDEPKRMDEFDAWLDSESEIKERNLQEIAVEA